MIRRAVSLVFALGLAIAGAAGLTYLLFFAAGWKGWMLMGAGMFLFVGLAWLYSDYIDATPNDDRDQRSSN